MNYLASHLCVKGVCLVVSLLALEVPGLTPVEIWAQDLDEATISGRITDQNGAVIPGARVTALLVKTGFERSVWSDDDGRYRLIELAPGEYTLRVEYPGFATQTKTNLAPVAGRTLHLDFVLQPAELSPAQIMIEVTEMPAVDTTRTVVGGTVTSEELEVLPNFTRSPLDLIFTLGGVSEEPLSTRSLAEDRNTNPSDTPEEAGSFALAGGPAYSNNLTIDGLDNNDDRGARERFQPSLESVEEVQVITNQFSSEYGRAGGGRINIRTRGGSSKYHGRGFYFFRNDILNANTPRNKARGLPRLPLEEHNPGFTLGGPIALRRDKDPARSFFFAAYEYDTVLDTATIDTLVPVQRNPLFPIPAPTSPDSRRLEDVTLENPGELPAEIAPFISTLSTPVRNHTLTGRVDHRFTKLHNATLHYQLGRQHNLRQFGGGNRLAESLLGKRRNTTALSYTDNFVFSASVFNQARVQFSNLSPAVEAAGGTKPVVLVTLNDSLLESDPQRRAGTLVAGSSTSGASERRESRIQIQDSLSWALGQHSLKFGVDGQHIRTSFLNLSDVSGTFTFASATDFLANAPSRFRQNFQTESAQRNIYIGLFAQDEWRWKSNFTLSYGLRYESESILRDRNNFGPRFAIAYDPFKSGKTVIRAGVGIFYNRALLRTIDDFTLGKQQLLFDTNELVDPMTGIALTRSERRAFIAGNLRFPEVLMVDSPLVREFGSLNTEFSRRLDQTLRIPESYQINVGFEREVAGALVFEANYSYNRGIHLWREFNANAPRLPAGFKNLTEYLLSRDFANFHPCPGCPRPLYDVSSAGELVRFSLLPGDVDNPNAIGNTSEQGVNISVFNLNSISSTTTVAVALDALQHLRPDPARTQIEQLASIGNSFYHGLILALRRSFRGSRSGFGFSFRTSYTLSRLIDDGIVNTSSALNPGDFRAERSRSLIDRRHRFVFSGNFQLPRWLCGLGVSPILRISSGAPFNISIGGNDRNLDDVGTDRPSFTGDLALLRSRGAGQPLEPALISSFSLPAIGQSGNLPRNAGVGPGQFFLDINITRQFRPKGGLRIRPVVEIDNLLNKTVMSFGAEFINFTGLNPASTPEQRRAFLESFLVPTRTLRPRQIRIGIRFDF